METKYEWIINQMDVKKDIGNLKNVVFKIHWTRKATLIDGDKTYFAESSGKKEFLNFPENNFTPYYELTQEQVSKWLDDMDIVDLLDENLNLNIDNQINLLLINLNLPWLTNKNK
jgi:hypothetical protein